jgi:hypothetical protein
MLKEAMGCSSWPFLMDNCRRCFKKNEIHDSSWLMLCPTIKEEQFGSNRQTSVFAVEKTNVVVMAVTDRLSLPASVATASLYEKNGVLFWRRMWYKVDYSRLLRRAVRMRFAVAKVSFWFQALIG